MLLNEVSMIERRRLLMESKEILEREFNYYNTLLIDFENFNITMECVSKSGFKLSLSIIVNKFKLGATYLPTWEIPDEWQSRLTNYHNLPREPKQSELEAITAFFKRLIDEDPTILSPLHLPTHSVERQQEELNNIVRDLRLLIESYREDFVSEEALSVKHELLNHLTEDSTLSNIWHTEIKGCRHLGALSYQLYLIEYKGFGFLLNDIGNSHWNFGYTVEEFLLNYHWNDEFHTKD